MKISGLGFFSLLTFVASFIPVAGIFIATIPPLIVALTEHGLATCVKVFYEKYDYIWGYCYISPNIGIPCKMFHPFASFSFI